MIEPIKNIVESGCNQFLCILCVFIENLLSWNKIVASHQ